MKVGSLFAGIGGLELGLERAGMEVVWQVEIDDYATRVLEKHWPNVHRERDVTKCGAHNLAPVDLICGGFPCQDLSLAGRRAGLAGERSGLWYEFARIIGELRPRWVLVENVPGLLSADDGGAMAQVLRDLAESGYDASWDCIPAAAVGAPHRRDRIFIVANAESARWASRTGAWQFGRCGEDVADTTSQHGERPIPERGRCGQSKEADRNRDSDYRWWWATEPNVGRVANGVPSRVDRLRCLGNAVVPQVAEWIGRRIIEAQRQQWI